MKTALWALLAAGLCAPASARNRKPYLVDASSTSATACWRQAGQDACLTFDRLAPGATFEYTISSVPYQGKALPALGAPLRFAVLGDSGMGTIAQKKVAALLDKSSPDLVLHVGDVVYPTGRDEDYDAKYFKIYAKTISRVAVFPCPGNHDYGNAKKSSAVGEKRFAQGYARVFRRPKYYSFDAGPVHFVSLDDNEADGLSAAEPIGLDGRQRRWLEKDLGAAKARWKIVFLHVPLFSTYYKHGDNGYLRATLQRLFEKHKVDAVFAGHDHIYQRSKRMNKVVYLTVGTGGGSVLPGPVSGHPWLEKERVAYGLGLVEVDQKRLTFRFLEQDGSETDRFSIDKP